MAPLGGMLRIRETTTPRKTESRLRIAESEKV
jgi:hypothetical protein